MSVYKSKRSTSAIQYVENARQLQVFTIKNCVKFPKRYTYIVVQKIANLVEDIDTHVRVAESMMPTNLHEAQLKRDELTYTFGLLNSLDDKLQLKVLILLWTGWIGTCIDSIESLASKA